MFSIYSILNVSHAFFNHTLYTILQSKQSWKLGVIILILQRKELKVREGKWLAKAKQQTGAGLI